MAQLKQKNNWFSVVC